MATPIINSQLDTLNIHASAQATAQGNIATNTGSIGTNVAALEATLEDKLDAQNLILNRIANKLGAYDEELSYGAMQAALRMGQIGQYVQTGGVLDVSMSLMVTASVSGTGVTSASVTKDTFIGQMGSDIANYVFTYDGAAWNYEGSAVSLASYGIVANGTPAQDDSITVMVTASTYSFDVDGADEEQPADETKKHVLPIQMQKVYSLLNFDPAMYLFAVTAEACTAFGWPSTGMPAGTYNITLNHGAYNNSTSEDDTYEFTTTQIVPVGGGIRHTTMGQYRSGGYAKTSVTGGTFTTYAADTYTAIETGLACTIGSSGTNLGTATAQDPSYKSGSYINFTQYQFYGCNRWSVSYIRQLLNSFDAALSWKPGTIWSRNLNIIPEGFLHAVDPELVAVLGKVRKRYAMSVHWGYGYEDIEDYVTLATMLDVFGSLNNNIAEGPVTADGTVTRTTATSLWKDSTAAERIKYDSGNTARDWWLGSCYPSNLNERFVNASGALSGYNPYSSFGVVPRLHLI